MTTTLEVLVGPHPVGLRRFGDQLVIDYLRGGNADKSDCIEKWSWRSGLL